MEDLNDKVLGGNLSATEWNQVPSELQNVIEQTGQTLTNADVNQVGKGIADYVSNSNFYTDSGVADAYVLTSIGLKQSPTAYVDGMAIEFLPGNTNTGASTVNVATLGVKNITGANAGDIVSGLRIVLKFRSGADDFVIDGGGDVVEEVNNVISGTGQTPDDVDQNQLGKGIAEYAANGDFYTDSGAADAYVLTVIGSKQGPVAYVDGMRVRFIADNANTTTPATINVAGLGVKNIVSLTAGDIPTTQQTTILYRLGTDNFVLAPQVAVGAESVGQTEIQTSSGNRLSPIVQVVSILDGTDAITTTLVPDDNTIPQNTEGAEFLTLAITPTNAANLIVIEIVGNFGATAVGNLTMMLIKNSIANSLAASRTAISATSDMEHISIRYSEVAGTTSVVTWRMRAGLSVAGTTRFNGEGGVARMGGVSNSSIFIYEIQQ